MSDSTWTTKGAGSLEEEQLRLHQHSLSVQALHTALGQHEAGFTPQEKGSRGAEAPVLHNFKRHRLR